MICIQSFLIDIFTIFYHKNIVNESSIKKIITIFRFSISSLYNTYINDIIIL